MDKLLSDLKKTSTEYFNLQLQKLDTTTDTTIITAEIENIKSKLENINNQITQERSKYTLTKILDRNDNKLLIYDDDYKIRLFETLKNYTDNKKIISIDIASDFLDIIQHLNEKMIQNSSQLPYEQISLLGMNKSYVMDTRKNSVSQILISYVDNVQYKTNPCRSVIISHFIKPQSYTHEHTQKFIEQIMFNECILATDNFKYIRFVLEVNSTDNNTLSKKIQNIGFTTSDTSITNNNIMYELVHKVKQSPTP